MDDKWSDDLRQRMEAHSEPPPDGLWDGIERKMDASSERRNVIFRVMRVGAAAAMAVFFLTIGHNVPERVPGNAPAENKPVEKVYAESRPETNHSEEKTYMTKVREEIFASEPDAAGEAIEAVEETIPPDTEEKRPDAKPEKPGRSAWTFNDGANPDVKIARPKNRKWQTSLYASNNIASGGFNSQRLSDSYDISDGTHHEHNYEAKHMLPLTVGVSVSYGLNEKWSISSGVTYSMFASRFQPEAKSSYEPREQVLHYIGIPLSVSYNIWRGERLSVYVSWGGQVEKNVSGNVTYKLVRNGETKPKRKEAIQGDRLQWSVNGSVGVQYDFVKNMGLYAEPGINYYFNNNSKLETVYKAKPVNFGIRLGLRFSL